MATLKLGSITAIVTGFTLNNGLPYFQKAVPTALRERIGKSTIKIRLHDYNGNYAVQCHRLDDQYAALFRAMKSDEGIVSSEAKLAAIALLDAVGLKPGDGFEEKIDLGEGRIEILQPAHDALQDFLVERDFNPSTVTATAFKALSHEFPTLLSEAFSVYLDNHRRGKDKKFIADQKQHWLKLINMVGDKPIKSVTREDARKFRDLRLASGVTSTTVEREISAIRAVFTKAIRELSLPISNQFSGLEIPRSGNNATERLPYTPEEIMHLVTKALQINDETRRIVIALALTGARLAEIVGLRKVDLDHKNMAILIRPHPGRSLKTDHSVRVVPLLPIAYEALKTQSEDADGDFLFPKYASRQGTRADSASATLNKWAKNFVAGRSMHCFRHSLRDQLRAVSCPEAIAKEIGGWSSSNDISVGYGQGYPLEVKRKWLTQAYKHCF